MSTMKIFCKISLQHKAVTMQIKLMVTSMLLTISVASEEFPIAKLGCSDSCGNVSIPYPFGMQEECYYSDKFFIYCNDTSDPPKPFLRVSNIHVTDIYLDGKLRILQYMASDCYNASGFTDRYTASLQVSDDLTISNADNVFVAIGCDTNATLKGYQSDHGYTVGCTSICDNIDYVPNDTCSGIGCCQTSLAKGVTNLSLHVGSFNEHKGILDFNPCSFAFVIDRSRFNFSIALLKDLGFDDYVPAIVEWSIGEDDCETIEKSGKYSACQGNSTCYNPENGRGYHCKCFEGYRGNPYLPSGCQDIDECNNITLNDCKQICINTPGKYECLCPKGYQGDGRKNGQGCIVVPHRSIVIPVTLGIGIALITLLLTFTWIIWGINKWKMMKLREKLFRQNGGLMLLEISRLQGPNTETTNIFTVKELEYATNKYDESRILGQGGYGTVYRGYLADGRVVAIKKSKIIDQTQISQFINEVVVLSRINHKNVVKLLGCCLEAEVPLLVYEFIANGTLFEHIHNNNNARSLTWDNRWRIAAETAGVLLYLHSAASIPIIHRDIKSNNILLDENYIAKVSDFGTSRLIPKDQDELATVVQGTLGYLDPEYLQTSQLTDKSDVYSFGVVLVELLTGQKALSSDRDEKARNLAMYFLCGMKEDQLLQILDKQIVHEGKIEQLIQVADLAKRYLRIQGEKRPTMKEVAIELEGLCKMENHPWVNQNIHDNGKETEYLLHESVGYEEAACTSSGYDSMKTHVVLPVRNGR